MTFGAFAVSPRLGEIRLAEVLCQVDGEAEEFDVVVLDEKGCAQRLLVRFAEKWAATSWQKVLQCHACGGPARVLQVLHDSAICGQCVPRLTAHHRHKSGNRWATEGALADQIIRGALDASRSRPTLSHQRHLGRQLKRNTHSRASALLDRVESLIHAVDNLTE